MLEEGKKKSLMVLNPMLNVPKIHSFACNNMFFFCVMHLHTQICRQNVSKDAVEEYMKYRYLPYDDTCDNPCNDMDIKNERCFKIRDPKTATDHHDWQNSACVKRGSFPFLFQPGGRAWWLPWSHSWPLTHAP